MGQLSLVVSPHRLRLGRTDLSTNRSGEMRVTLLGTEAIDNLVDELEGLSIDAFLLRRVG